MHLTELRGKVEDNRFCSCEQLLHRGFSIITKQATEKHRYIRDIAIARVYARIMVLLRLNQIFRSLKLTRQNLACAKQMRLFSLLNFTDMPFDRMFLVVYSIRLKT